MSLPPWLPIAVVLLAAAIGLGVLTDGLVPAWFSLEGIQAGQASLAARVAAAPFTAAVSFSLAAIVAVALAMPGAGVLPALLAGALFGLGTGTLLISFASAIGATLSFLISRHLLRQPVRRMLVARAPASLARLDAGLQEEGGFYLFALRLAMLLPFVVINLVAGLTAMRVWTFYWVTQLGMAPGLLIYVNAGQELSRLDSVASLLSPSLLLSLALLGLAPLLGRRLVRWLLRWLRR